MRQFRQMGMLLCILGELFMAGVGWALPKPADVKTLQARLAAARRTLEASGADLDEADRKQLLAKFDAAEKSLAQFVDTSNKHAKRKGLAPLYAVGGALALDDATGVGVADDMVLAIVGLAILLAHFAGEPKASTPELERAWGDVSVRVQELSQEAERIRSKRKPGCYCKCFKEGVGPEPVGRVPDEGTCRKLCHNEHHYPGYRCGGPVRWD